VSTPEQQLKEAVGNQDPLAALAVAERAVRAEPAQARHRVALFQVMCVLGQWERALAQLDAIAQLDAQALAMVSTYREAIKCELFRASVFAGKSTPLAFGEPQPWLAWLVEALQRDAQGDAAVAAALREKAFDDAVFPSGTADGEAFEWIADSDPRLGPVCEAIVNGRYYWMPMTALAQIDIDKPEDLRDFVWAPAHFQFVNGGESVGLIPTRYPGTEASGDGALQLARKTVWGSDTGLVAAGSGQRILATEAREYPLLDVRRITFDSAAGSA
jgi:type VI secretion system protein ImpE